MSCLRLGASGHPPPQLIIRLRFPIMIVHLIELRAGSSFGPLKQKVARIDRTG
jgi:hypothetical protein